MDIAKGWQKKLVREIRRKAIHLSGLSVPISLLAFGRGFTVAFVALALAVSLVLEWQRLKGNIRLPEVREQEEHRVASFIYYITGSLLCVLLFPVMIAVNAILLLSLGDTVSGLVGSVLSRSDVRSKKEAWCCKPAPIVATMFFACLAIGFLASSITHLAFPIYLAGAVGATFADCVAIVINNKPLDDNFSIPVLSGLMMALAAALL